MSEAAMEKFLERGVLGIVLVVLCGAIAWAALSVRRLLVVLAIVATTE